MAFNSLGQYTPAHKVWDHVGNLLPNMEHSEGDRPHGNLMPAAWLPVRFFDKFYENWITVMPGKLVAFDNDGRLVPAQYGLGGANITYTASDVLAGTIDVRTGKALVSGQEGTFSVASVSAFMGRTSVALAVGAPVGVCPYPYLQWAGDGSALDDGNNPAAYRQHNYNMQARVALLCDYVLELPIVPQKTSSEALSQASFDASKKLSTFTAVAQLPVAKNTQRTQITFSGFTHNDQATRFVNEQETVADVKMQGDWHIDLTTGVLTVFSTLTLGANAYRITYHNYAAAPTGSNVSVFACVLGAPKPGDFLKCNADSNWIVDASPTVKDTMGQVLDIESKPQSSLEKVRTAYPSLATSGAGAFPGYAGQMDQMPGSATGGVPDKVHYSGAANLVCRVNLVTR